MHASTRLVVLALVVGALLLLPVGADARRHDATTHAIAIEDQPSLPVALRLRVTVARDGTARVRGTVHERGSVAPVLEAAPNGARAAFADMDGDGTSGLVRLTADFRNVETGQRVRFVLAPTEHDMDVSGDYAVELQLDESGMIGDIRTVISGEAA